MRTQVELSRKLYALESYFDDIPAPELILALVPAEVRLSCSCAECVSAFCEEQCTQTSNLPVFAGCPDLGRVPRHL